MGKLIDQGELEEAGALFRQVYEESDLSLYELGKLWQQRARTEIALGLYSEAKHSFAELVDAVGDSSDRVVVL